MLIANPKGITVEKHLDGSTQITCRPQYSWATAVFLLIWLTAWTIGCLWILYGYINGAKMDSGEPMPFWFVVIFWSFEFLGLYLLFRIIFMKKIFIMNLHELLIKTTFPLLNYVRRYPREDISHIKLVYDKDAEGSSWGVFLLDKQDKQHPLIETEPYDQMYRLGQELSKWLKTVLLEEK